MIAVVQSIAAAVGSSQTSIQAAIRRHYGLGWALLALVAVVAVNVFTLAADLVAGAESLKLLSGLPRAIFVLPFAAGTAWLLLARSYLRIERLLSYLPFIFICYGISAVLAKPDWRALLRSLIVPHFDFTLPVVTGALALLGTTLTSYVYYWESIEVAERGTAPSEARTMKADAAWGALAPGICFLFILVATAATLGRTHTSVQTATDAAIALQPLAGPWATALFAIGLLASAANRSPDPYCDQRLRRHADVRLARKPERVVERGAHFLRRSDRLACICDGTCVCGNRTDRAALLGLGCRRFGDAAHALAPARGCKQSRRLSAKTASAVGLLPAAQPSRPSSPRRARFFWLRCFSSPRRRRSRPSSSSRRQDSRAAGPATP